MELLFSSEMNLLTKVFLIQQLYKQHYQGVGMAKLDGLYVNLNILIINYHLSSSSIFINPYLDKQTNKQNKTKNSY